MAVGGMSIMDSDTSNVVYTYNEQSKEWKQTIPPMPTGRILPSCLSLQSALIVAGGVCDSFLMDGTNVVEIFKPDASQWYTANPLPTPCVAISLVEIGNTCYALGGFSPQLLIRLNQSNFASVDDLLLNAIKSTPIRESDVDDNNKIPSSWKELPYTPTFKPTGAVLFGNLIAAGGTVAKKEVYMFSPASNSWVYISDLPAPCHGAGVASLSPSDILVGGQNNDNHLLSVRVSSLFNSPRPMCGINSVYKGTLKFKI